MEIASTYTKIMIEQLLNVHALTNMWRVSRNDETRKTAQAWLPKLEDTLRCLKRELEQP